MTMLAQHLQVYFTTFAHNQRSLSPHTITAYRDTWRMLLTFLAAEINTRPDFLDFGHIDAANVSAFLNHLENDRGNTIATRNARLTAIRAVLTRALPNQLDHAGTLAQVLAIPPKRGPRSDVEFLTGEESTALINAPDHNRWTGRRDYALLVLAVQTGLRISELITLTLTNIHFGAGAGVTCLGKGRRRRVTPMTTSTETVMRAYIDDRKNRPGTALFCGPHGNELSRDAIEHRLRIHVAAAAANCPSLAGKHITMHTLRHTAAMSLLAGGVDISVIALWMGHQRTQSTDVYLHADMTIKQAALDRTRPLDTRPGVYKPEPDILAWLHEL